MLYFSVGKTITNHTFYLLCWIEMPEREWANSNTTTPISDSHQPIHLSYESIVLKKKEHINKMPAALLSVYPIVGECKRLIEH